MVLLNGARLPASIADWDMSVLGPPVRMKMNLVKSLQIFTFSVYLTNHKILPSDWNLLGENLRKFVLIESYLIEVLSKLCSLHCANNIVIRA
jgi:hypothetical protein